MCGGSGGWLLLCKEGNSQPIHKHYVFMQLSGEGGVVLVSACQSVAQSHYLWSEELYPFICNFISHVVADFVCLLYHTLIYHVLCGIAFDIGDPDGGGPFGCNLFVV